MGASHPNDPPRQGTPAKVTRSREASSKFVPNPIPEATRLYLACDRATEWLIYFTVVFSPWAFGTTQPWSIRVMNSSGYLLGVLLVAKWLLRSSKGWLPRWNQQEHIESATQLPGIPRWPARLLAVLTVLILGYCLTSALNARATYIRSEFRFAYHDFVP